MKNIFSRKHDTQTGNSKYKFWISGSSQGRSAPRPVPIQTDNTRIQADIRTSSRAVSVTNLQPSTGEDKPVVSVSTPGTIYPTTRTNTVPQAALHPSRPSSSKHRDDAKYEPPRAGYTSTHEREDRTKGFRRAPSRNEVAPKNWTDLWPLPQSSKQPEPLDTRFQEHEDTRRYRNEDNDARYGIRMESLKAKEPREGMEDRFRVFRDEYGTIRDRHVTSQRVRDKDRARESEPEGIRERERDKMRQKERERHQREYEKERERQKGEKQQREYEREQERERVRQQEMENEVEREREKAIEKQRERQKELERESQRDEKERQRLKEERQREKQREFEKERERQKELERERLKEERERERQMQKEREMERERRMELEREWERQKEERERERETERQRRLEQARLKEEREREQLEKERERQKELEREKEERERQKELERERLKERERQVQKEREMERERERERELERERERELERERERQVQKEREREQERQKELERERLKEERRMELERERERERERLKERERERRMELEREREREREERERERQVQKERELEKERERKKELERERLKEERRMELERERERLKERERERRMEHEREREREREEKERERQVQKDRERQKEMEQERQRQNERERQKELEQERQRQNERERQKELEQEIDRERAREHEKQKELQQLKDLERERLDQGKQEPEHGNDQGRKETARNRTRGRERQDKDDHDRERLRHQGPVIMAKPSTLELADPSQRDSDRAEGITRAVLKTFEARPIADGEYRKEKALKDPPQGQEHYQQTKPPPDLVDANKDRLRTQDRERRKEGKPRRLSDDQPNRALRTFRQLRHERPVVDGWGDSSDDSGDHPQTGPKHDRTGDEKSVQVNPGGWNVLAPGNEFQLNQPPINLLPPYTTPRAAPILLTSTDTLTSRHAGPLASGLVNIGTPHDSEPVRREINRSKLSREDAGPLKPTESSRPPSRVSFVQGINPLQSTPPQTQNHLAQLKDVQPSSHAKASSKEAQSVPIELPVNTVLNSWSIAQEAGRFPGDDNGLKTFPDPPMESSREVQVPSMRQMGSAQPNKAYKGKRMTDTPIALTLPTEVHPTQMESEEEVPRIVPPKVQNGNPPVSMDVERHEDPLVGANTRPSTTTDAPNRTRISSVTPMPNLGISVLATPDSTTVPSVGPHTQILASLSPPNILHPVNHQPNRNFTNSSTTAFATSATQSHPAVPTAPSAKKLMPPTSALTSHNGESTSIPVPSSEKFTVLSTPSVNASPYMRVPPQSGTGIPTPAETPFLAGPPMLNWDRNVAARPEIRQFSGSKADSPLLTKKDESVHQVVQTTSSNTLTRGEVNKVDLGDVPSNHHAIVEAQIVPRRVQYHDVEPSKIDNTDPNNPSLVVGLILEGTGTCPGTEVSVLDKTTEKPSPNHGRVHGLTGMAPSGPTSSTHGEPVKYWEGPSSNLVVDTQNQRDPTELGRTAFPSVGHDASGQQTPDIAPRSVGKPTTSGNHRQEADDKEIGLSIGRPSTTSGSRKSDPHNHPRISWKKVPNETILEEQTTRQDARSQNQVVTSNMRLSMVSGLKADHSRGPGPPHIAPSGTQTNRQSPGSGSVQVTDQIGALARPFDRSPRRSLLHQTAEVRMTGSKASLDYNTASQPKEAVPLVKEASNQKVDALSFSQTPGVISDDVTSNALYGSRKESPLARQWVVNTPMTTHPLLPINLEGPGKHDNHNPSAQIDNAEHAVPSSATTPPHSDIRGPHFANVVLAPPMSHATVVPTTLESQVEIVPQIKIRPMTADGIKQGTEVSLSSRTLTFSGAPETAAVMPIPTTSPASQISGVRKMTSFGNSLAGVGKAKVQPGNQHNESPENRLLKVDDVPVSSFAASTKVRSHDFDVQTKKRSNKESPRIKKAEPTLTRVLLRDADEPGKKKPSSKKESPKAVAIIGNSKQDAVHFPSSRQDNAEQLRSSKLSTQELPVIAHQAGFNSDVLQTKIQHPVLAELLSSPQTASVMQLTPVQVLDRGQPKEVHLSSTPQSIQSKLHGTPPERHRQELEQKMRPTKEAAPISRSSHRKHSTFHTGELLREHHQLQTAVDVVTRAKLARTSDQVGHDQRKNTENSNPSQPSHGGRVNTQEHNRIPEFQRDTAMASRSTQQSLQHTQGRQHHSVSVPTSSAIPENVVRELPGSVAQGRGDISSDKQVLSVPPSETVPMTPSSFTTSLALRQTDPRQPNAGKKIRRFRLPSTQAGPTQSYQVWHPGTPLKTPDLSPSHSNGIPLEHNLNPKEPNKNQSVPFPTGKDADAAVGPFKYVTHRKKRSVSGASMEARHGTAPSTIVGSPNASMHSATPLPPPPTRDPWKATHDWVSKAEDRAQARPKRKRPRPGVVFDTDEDAPEDKQRPRRTITKHRSAAKRHESPTS